jgi:DNA-binding transcriptional LysR family regulator
VFPPALVYAVELHAGISMNLYHLSVFQIVAEHEHITRASEELVLSQPAVSKIIQSLEREIGLELIERHGRRIVLTHAGHVLHQYARRIFALEREMKEALEALQDIGSGEIKLAANTTAGVYVLPPIVSLYRNRYPRVVLYMTILNSGEIIEQVLNWTLDFGLVEGDPTTLPPELHVEVFAQDELVLVVSPDHRWSTGEAIHPEAFGEWELLLREKGSGIREVIEHACMLHGIHVKPLLTIPDNEAIKQMVISGVGAAIVSALTVQRELKSGDLVRVPLDGFSLRPRLSLVRRSDKQLSPAAQAFWTLVTLHVP